MAYFTKVRLHYRAEDGKTKIAPANSIIFDMDDALIEGALAQDYIRPATEGEAADARALMPAPKKAKKSPKAEKKPGGDDTQPGGDDTQPGGDDTQSGASGDDDLA